MNTINKKAKIIATIGPASRSKEMIWKLHKAGANIFRLNFSHGSHDDHLKVIEWVRELNVEHGTNICLLQDLQGNDVKLTYKERFATFPWLGDTKYFITKVQKTE